LEEGTTFEQKQRKLSALHLYQLITAVTNYTLLQQYSNASNPLADLNHASIDCWSRDAATMLFDAATSCCHLFDAATSCCHLFDAATICMLPVTKCYGMLLAGALLRQTNTVSQKEAAESHLL
jgi:hypothetical protein